jgi:hypothetical protein
MEKGDQNFELLFLVGEGTLLRFESARREPALEGVTLYLDVNDHHGREVRCDIGHLVDFGVLV